MRVPTSSRAIASTGFCVADRPMRTSGRGHSACRRSRLSARWLPRLLPARAWISSTITVRVPASMRRPDSEPSSTYSDSGVVTRMCGGRLRIEVRSVAGVSPVRTAVRMSTSGRPSRSSSARMPPSGTSRLRWMSFDKAFNGET
uniref:Response regulator n=1 Tax=Mizugakiibacter sediminis TaxID=1475481 RepID=A0A0S6YY90_9GAMM